MGVYNARHGSIVLETGSANTFTLSIEDVGLSVDELTPDNREALAVYDRGVFDGLLPGQDVAQSLSVTFKVKNESLTHASNARALDYILKIAGGSVASDTTIDAYGFEWSLKMTITLNDGTTSTSFILPNTRPKASYAEALEGCAITMSGTNYTQPTYS